MPLRLIVDNEPTGEILKDEGIASALRFIDPLLWRAWEDAVYDLLEGWKGISEEIRFVVEAQGFHAHPNHLGRDDQRQRRGPGRSPSSSRKNGGGQPTPRATIANLRS